MFSFSRVVAFFMSHQLFCLVLRGLSFLRTSAISEKYGFRTGTPERKSGVCVLFQLQPIVLIRQQHHNLYTHSHPPTLSLGILFYNPTRLPRVFCAPHREKGKLLHQLASPQRSSSTAATNKREVFTRVRDFVRSAPVGGARGDYGTPKKKKTSSTIPPLDFVRVSFCHVPSVKGQHRAAWKFKKHSYRSTFIWKSLPIC